MPGLIILSAAAVVALVAGAIVLLTTRKSGAPTGLPGATVSTVDHPDDKVGEFGSIAIGTDGLPVISYLDFTAFELKVAHCNDPACAGENETITTLRGAGSGFNTSIAIGADGLPVISYFDASVGAVKVARCDDAACVRGGFATIQGPPGAGPGTSMAIGADGYPVIAFGGSEFGDLMVAHCNDPACVGGGVHITKVIDGSKGKTGSAPAITIGADGFPVISFLNFDTGVLWVVHCNDPACMGGDEVITPVDDFGQGAETSPFTSIAIGRDGLPLVAYTDAAESFRVAHCNDPACTGLDETITSVASGFDPSIAVGADGLPLIGLSTLGAIEAVHCNDPACAGKDEAVTTVDAEEGHSYYYVSLAVGSDGLPVIAYHDGTDGKLKVAHLEE